jgi:arabinofuranosyltransferase
VKLPTAALRRLAPTLLAAVPALVVLLYFLHYYFDFVCDDAFISFRYAEHLGTGRGLAWNPGELPRVEGYTNFLWVVLLGLLRALGMGVPSSARLLAWLSAAGISILIVLAASGERSAEGRKPSLLLLALAPLPVALSFPFQYWTVLRLETPLFGFLLLLSTYLFVLEEQRGRPRRFGSSLAFLALALTRPEGAIFIAVPGLYLLWQARTRKRFREVLAQRWLWLAIFFGGMLLYVLWRWVYFGELLPNTYYAKVGGSGGLRRGWDYLARFAEHRPHTFVFLLGALLLGGLGSRTGRLLLATIAVLCLAVVIEGGDWMREFRLLIPTTPLCGAALAVALQRRLEEGWRSRLAPLLGMILLCVFVQASAGTPLEEWGAVAAGRRRDMTIALEGEMTLAHRAAGEWLRKNGGKGDLVAVNHAGATPFYSDLPTLDMAGLNDRHIARLVGVRHNKWDPAYVLGRKPAFIVLNTRTDPRGGYVPGYWGGETALFTHPLFAKQYRAVPGAVWAWHHRPVDARNVPGLGTAWVMIFRREAEGSR